MNGTLMQYFEWYYTADGSLWNTFKADAEKLAAMGITAVWLPPAYKGSRGADSEGYDVYDIYDLGEFDQKGSVRTKYGTKQEYIDAVNKAHGHGLQIYMDVVLNHMGGGDEIEKIAAKKVNPDNRNEYLTDTIEIESFTKFTFPGRQGNYSQFVWDHQCFTGVDYARNLHEQGVYHIENGKEGWQDVLDDEKGNFDYLMFSDIEFRNKAVREELKRWIKWYYSTVQFDGLRLDAVKHIPPAFYNEWVDHVHHEIKENMFVVGEYWSSNPDLLLQYIDATEGRMSLFDAPLQSRFHNASNAGKDFDMSKIFEGTLVAANPGLAVTLVDNHDTQPCQALEAPVAGWFKPLAYALILLREHGYPCVFYPDMYGAAYIGEANDGNACHIKMEKVTELEQLLALRKSFAYGPQRDYLDHANCIGWTREGNEEYPAGCAVVMSNGEEGHKYMELGKQHAGKLFADSLQKHPAEVRIDENGFGTFYCAPGSVSVYIPKEG